VAEQPESLVLALLRDMRTDMGSMRGDIAELRTEMRSLRADVASDMIDLEKRLGDQIAGLRRAVMEYHSSAIGHGVLISGFEERLRRVERRLDITPDPH
jgi:hypothetical protein